MKDELHTELSLKRELGLLLQEPARPQAISGWASFATAYPEQHDWQCMANAPVCRDRQQLGRGMVYMSMWSWGE
jgi:hypothetical protein